MSVPRIRIIPPDEPHREGGIAENVGELEYLPRFMRESYKRSGSTHIGPTLMLEVVDEHGRLERLVKTVTLTVDDSGEIRLMQEQVVLPSFLTPPVIPDPDGVPAEETE